MAFITRNQFYIDGKWVDPTSDGTIEVTDPTTEKAFARVPAGAAPDIDLAVEAAAVALAGWSEVDVSRRVTFCSAIADALTKRSDELAEIITRELGMPLDSSKHVQVGLAIRTFSSMATVVDDVRFEEYIGSTKVVRTPIGVVGAITPWNYPLHQIAAKIAPAIVAGNTVVLKPSEVTPLNAFILAEIFDEVGLPAGVVNVVTGYGAVAGERLAEHPLVDMVSFTGSTGAGRRVSEIAARTVKRTALELGGKSANVILSDVEGELLQKAVTDALGACFYNSGQTCTALTRLVVPREKLSEVEAILKDGVATFTVGNPFHAGTRLGPLVSKIQRDRVREHIERGEKEGARLIAGGPTPPAHLDEGYFVRPTIFSGVTAEMSIAQDEIFGPVLTVLAYDDEEDALHIANDSEYGLSGGVWSSDVAKAERFARRVRTGMIKINDGEPHPDSPFGGFKQSGHGREYGKFGLEEFLSTQALYL
uniref:aldehyde dehydrogenase family protein n=1 Tax=Rhodococcus qingshengii TaxID=334542 RepID=UPI001C4DF74C|nr:aldehyde dehydrogenase family protein [Rhodococcus qingshengii]